MVRSTWMAMLVVLGLSVVGVRLHGAEPDENKVVAGDNRFALELYGRLRQEPGDLFCSPYSISSALAMTYAGARGETATQMAAALHFGPNDAKFHAAFGQVIRDLNAGGKKGGYQLSVANALWAQQGHKFLADYTQQVTAEYEAGLEELDFRTATEAARQTINSWVEKKTNDKIRDLLKPGVVTEDTRLVLTNAIYFKSGWMHPFEKDATQTGPFTHADGSKSDVPLMNQTHRFKYAKRDGFAAVELPYAQGELSMLVLLPEKPDAVGELETKLTPAMLADVLTKSLNREVDLSLPRFKATSEFSLKDVLASLGMRDAFTDAADFSGMDGAKDLSIQHVVHKAFVDVNEVGTEAAAATGVAVGVTSIQQPEPPVVFHADHPFLFLIRDTRTGSLLFIGRVLDPKGS